jgi:hypothetical protein
VPRFEVELMKLVDSWDNPAKRLFEVLDKLVVGFTEKFIKGVTDGTGAGGRYASSWYDSLCEPVPDGTRLSLKRYDSSEFLY